MNDFVFAVAGFVCVLSALFIVSRKNPVYSVVFMLPFFLGMTTIFVWLSASFLAAMQMMVYGGAILVVFLFVIMLINLKPEELREDFAPLPYALSFIGAAALGLCVVVGVRDGATPEMEANFGADLGNKNFGSVEDLALPLFNQHLVPFELASILIGVAVLGAVLLSKKRA